MIRTFVQPLQVLAEASQSDAFAQHLLTFYSVIVAVVAAEFFTGWRRLHDCPAASSDSDEHVRAANRFHVLWTIVIFALLIETWWGAWLVKDKIYLNFGYFLSLLVSPVIFYVIT